MGCEEAPGVGLPPLEFTECLADSPQFRENLQCHEKELERTSQQIKRLIKEVKDVVSAARRLGAAQLVLANSLEQFDFACIGASMTEDERAISGSLRHLAAIIRTVEDERGRMLSRAHDQIIQPLETFRKDNIGAVKEGKKKFDKKTAKFCQTQERTLSLSARKPENVFQEADAALEMASRDFCAASLEYVFELQALQERKKFELVETLLGWLLSWGTFHHAAQDVHADAEPLLRALQLTVQRTRSNFEETSKQTECLMKKMMEVRQANKEEEPGGEENGTSGSNVTKAGYLFLFEKKAFGATWTKHYCSYDGGERTLTITPYNQINVKTAGCSETFEITGGRSASDAERRFCFEALCAERAPLVLQARGAGDRGAWLAAFTGAVSARQSAVACRGGGGAALDAAGFRFVNELIAEVERRGLSEQGLYRVGGVTSRAARLVSLGAAGSLPSLRDAAEWDTRTLTSALKLFLRSLPNALLAPAHARLMDAAKLENRASRQAGIARHVVSLPAPHRAMLGTVVRHLRRVAACSHNNRMCASNLAVCFGPTLMRAEKETVASILDIKFYNVCVEVIIQHPTLLREPGDSDNGGDASPAGSLAVSTRDDMSVLDRGSCARYSPQHTSLLQSFPLAPLAPPCPPSPPLLGPPVPPAPRRVRTLYACVAEAEGELSFEANQVICDVRASAEPGWLTGTLAGRTGLVPLNYVEPLP